MSKRSVVVLTRRQKLVAQSADWDLPQVDLFVYESPSEALAKLSLAQTSVFVFDTRDYPRFKHVVRKFFSLKTDTDLVVVGHDIEMPDPSDTDTTVAVRTLSADASGGETEQVIRRLLQLRAVREGSGIVGRSRAVSEMLSLIAHAAPLHVNVLILGESGTGKELVARAIHDNSLRNTGPFVSLNCGAVNEGVLESELFGHVRGAFTGAVSDHAGVFERADGGTLFLDEVAEMPLGMQTRFLRALETGEFTPVGGRTTKHSDIRLLAATHRDLAADVARGRFRQDLYYRLRVVVIETPPLRERMEDIPVLVDTFLQQENERHGLHVRGLTRAAEQELIAYDWPGNVRELRNMVSSVVVLKQRGLVDVDDLPREIRESAGRRHRPYLPVPMEQAAESTLDLGLLASTLLELRHDIKEIKAMLQERGLAGEAGWSFDGRGRLPTSGGVVETFSDPSGYSAFGEEQIGDIQTAERALIESALRATGGNRRQAAERLGISERTLYRKIKLYDLT